MLDTIHEPEEFEMPVIEKSAPTRSDEYLTSAELGKRHKMSVATLANHRSTGEGLPYVRLPSGTILYKLADVLRIEEAGTQGFSWSRLNDALALYPGMTDANRKALIDHLRKMM